MTQAEALAVPEQCEQHTALPSCPTDPAESSI